MSDEIQAAGGLVMRGGESARRAPAALLRLVAAEGEARPGRELAEEAALREVEEEAGVRGRLVRELPAVTYKHRGRPKRVRYWLMELAEDPPAFEPNDEVDEVRWASPADALELLSYERDRTCRETPGSRRAESSRAARSPRPRAPCCPPTTR